MEIKGRYRVMWWIGIILTVVSFLWIVADLWMEIAMGWRYLTYGGIYFFYLFNFPVCLIWLVWACVARHRKMWGYFGIIFSIYIAVSSLALYSYTIQISGIFYFIVEGIINICMVLAMAFMIFRRQELMALMSYGSSKKARSERTEKEQQALNAVYSMETGRTQKPKAAPVPVQKTVQESPAYKKVDVNHCQMEDLLELPGISLEMAQKVIKDRAENGMYQSPDDFLRRNPVKPHFMEQIVARIEIKPENEGTMAAIQKEESGSVNEKKRGLDL